MVQAGGKDNKSWYSGIGDWFSGASQSASKGISAAQSGIAGSGAAQTFGKASGLSPYMKMFGMSPEAAPPEDRMAKPSELRDLAEGKAPATPGGSFGGMWDVITGKSGWGNKVVGDTQKNGFEKIKNSDGSSGGYKMPSYQNWDARGRSFGNRQDDIDSRDKPMKVGMKPGEVGAKTVKAPEIYQPDLSKLNRETTGQKSIASAKETAPGSGIYENNTGAGAFTDVTTNGKSGDEQSAWTSHTDAPKWGAKTKIDPLTGKGYTSFLSGGYQGGAEYKTGYRAGAMSDDKRFTADAEAGFVANAGVSGQYGLDTKNGLYATGGVGGKVGFYGQANADAKSEKLKLGGVDYDAGIGVHADVFAGAKAGAGATIGMGPDFIGAKGNIGAFVGAEAAADIHGNLGPLAGKVGASGMVGAGIGADGDISFKDGKFHIGGKMFAALGYGGSLSADMTVDVGAIGKSAYNLGAAGLDYAGKGISAAGKGINNAYNATSKAIGGAYDSTTKAVGSAWDSGTKAVGNAWDSGTKAVGNAYNATTDWAGKQASNIASGATNLYNGAAQGLSNAGTAVSNTASNLYNGAASGLSNGVNAIASW